MRTRLLLLLFLALPLSAAERWIGWKVPSYGTRTTIIGGAHCSSRELLLAVRVDGERIERLRLFDPVCQPGLDGLTVEMRSMTPEASLDYLTARLRDARDPGKIVTAIALHEHPNVIPKLIALARHDERREVRRKSLFWLGQRAGDKAAAELRRAVDEDPDDDVRQHAVFAIAQLPRERAVPLLADLARTHKSRRVRERALFWLAQTEDPRALEVIEEILGVR